MYIYWKDEGRINGVSRNGDLLVNFLTYTHLLPPLILLLASRSWIYDGRSASIIALRIRSASGQMSELSEQEELRTSRA